MDPTSHDKCPYERERRKADAEKKERPGEGRGRDWSSAARGRGPPELPEAAEARKDPALERVEGAHPGWHAEPAFCFPK